MTGLFINTSSFLDYNCNFLFLFQKSIPNMETHFVGLCTVVNHSGNGSRPIPFRAHLIDSQTKSAINSRLKRTIKLHPYQCNYNECVSALKEKFPVLNEENFILTWKGKKSF